MNNEKKDAFKLPYEWVDRIFMRLTEIYGEKFIGKFSKPEYIEMEKNKWCSGLYGLDSHEIRKVLNLCLNNRIKSPPNVVEFYHYAKNYKIPTPLKPELTSASLETRSKYMELIRAKLNGSNTNKRHNSVPPDNQQILDDPSIPEWLQNGN